LPASTFPARGTLLSAADILSSSPLTSRRPSRIRQPDQLPSRLLGHRSSNVDVAGTGHTSFRRGRVSMLTCLQVDAVLQWTFDSLIFAGGHGVSGGRHRRRGACKVHNRVSDPFLWSGSVGTNRNLCTQIMPQVQDQTTYVTSCSELLSVFISNP
jgi:hypothetical protein